MWWKIRHLYRGRRRSRDFNKTFCILTASVFGLLLCTHQSKISDSSRYNYFETSTEKAVVNNLTGDRNRWPLVVRLWMTSCLLLLTFCFASYVRHSRDTERCSMCFSSVFPLNHTHLLMLAVPHDRKPACLRCCFCLCFWKPTLRSHIISRINTEWIF